MLCNFLLREIACVQALLRDFYSNLGLAFNRLTWKAIFGCRQEFCNYDDYNWDWSLQHILGSCTKSRAKFLVVKGPRVFHTGIW